MRLAQGESTVIEAARTSSLNDTSRTISVMKIRRLRSVILPPLVASLVASCSSSNIEQDQTGRKSSEPTPVAMASAVAPPLLASSPAPAATPKSVPPPRPDEINSAVWRVFDKVATADFSRKPAFIVGDFNGDGSEDLAVEIKPNEGQIGEINNHLANWVLENPKNVAKRPTQRTPVKAETGEILLAVIHGAGAQGWRDPEARQTYLVKNEGATNMSSQSLKNLQTSRDKENFPQLRGDVIGETLKGKTGILYWTGAKYAWHQTR